jgi:hypothetical protein
MAGLLMKLYL